MNIIEAWGSGIPRMFQEAKEYGLREPELIDMGSDFRVNLYRAEIRVDQFGILEPKTGTDGTKVGTNGTKVGTNGTDEDVVLDIIQQNPRVSQKKLYEETGIPLRTVKRIMAALQRKGKIERKGSNRSGEWIIKL